jgi:hypothetical protein
VIDLAIFFMKKVYSSVYEKRDLEDLQNRIGEVEKRLTQKPKAEG